MGADNCQWLIRFGITLGARDNLIIEKMLTKMIMKGIIVPK